MQVGTTTRQQQHKQQLQEHHGCRDAHETQTRHHAREWNLLLSSVNPAQQLSADQSYLPTAATSHTRYARHWAGSIHTQHWLGSCSC
jgi:hypothetical protein